MPPRWRRSQGHIAGPCAARSPMGAPASCWPCCRRVETPPSSQGPAARWRRSQGHIAGPCASNRPWERQHPAGRVGGGWRRRVPSQGLAAKMAALPESSCRAVCFPIVLGSASILLAVVVRCAAVESKPRSCRQDGGAPRVILPGRVLLDRPWERQHPAGRVVGGWRHRLPSQDPAAKMAALPGVILPGRVLPIVLGSASILLAVIIGGWRRRLPSQGPAAKMAALPESSCRAVCCSIAHGSASILLAVVVGGWRRRLPSQGPAAKMAALPGSSCWPVCCPIVLGAPASCWPCCRRVEAASSKQVMPPRWRRSRSLPAGLCAAQSSLGAPASCWPCCRRVEAPPSKPRSCRQDGGAPGVFLPARVLPNRPWERQHPAGRGCRRVETPPSKPGSCRQDGGAPRSHPAGRGCRRVETPPSKPRSCRQDGGALRSHLAGRGGEV